MPLNWSTSSYFLSSPTLLPIAVDLQGAYAPASTPHQVIMALSPLKDVKTAAPREVHT
jgi:hypothetical protein